MSTSLTQRFAHKIKTAEELRDLLGQPPRRQKTIMCHGVFDVVHPGHLRHLLYAKSKADTLIASITADKHIDKGKYRPHVPEDLRAANLAAFEMVDYVVIDRNATPISNLGCIQPDIFAKGYEYQSGGLNPKTAEELAILQGYGGQLLFTPGDVVYSSSMLIDLEPPTIKYDKLLTLMERSNLTFDDLRRTLLSIPGKKVHVVGDTIVDTITNCTMIGGQTKTPTMSVRYENSVNYIGGAGIVAKHMRAAGSDVVFSTVMGNDELGELAVNDLHESGVDVRAIVDVTRPTTEKNAIVVGGYRLLKVDTLDNRSIEDAILSKLLKEIETAETDAIVYSDFRHGIFNRRTIPQFIAARPAGAFSVADSQVASRWGNITDFKGFDLITPNEREARFAVADQDSGVRALSSQLYDQAQCKTLILKLGDRGVLTCQSNDHESSESFFSIDSFVENLVDAVGAGDALLAYSTLSMLVSQSPAQASILGSMAAACECSLDGNIPVTVDDVMKMLDTAEKEMDYQ